MGRDSPVGIATPYGLDGPGSESRWGTDFLYLSRPTLGPTQPHYTMGTGSLPGVKRPGRNVDHPPYLTPRLKKEHSYTSTTLWAFVACSRAIFIFTLPTKSTTTSTLQLYFYCLIRKWATYSCSVVVVAAHTACHLPSAPRLVVYPVRPSV